MKKENRILSISVEVKGFLESIKDLSPDIDESKLNLLMENFLGQKLDKYNDCFEISFAAEECFHCGSDDVCTLSEHGGGYSLVCRSCGHDNYSSRIDSKDAAELYNSKRCPSCDSDKSKSIDKGTYNSVLFNTKECTSCGVKWDNHYSLANKNIR